MSGCYKDREFICWLEALVLGQLLFSALHLQESGITYKSCASGLYNEQGLAFGGAFDICLPRTAADGITDDENKS